MHIFFHPRWTPELRYHSELHPSPFKFKWKKSCEELSRHILPSYISFPCWIHISLSSPFFSSLSVIFFLAAHPDPENKSGGLNFITWEATTSQTTESESPGMV